MKRLVLLIVLIFIGLYLNAQEFGCSQMSENWKSEKEAVRRIESTIFKSHDSVRPNEDSWMTSAHFYSCNDVFGYLLIKSEKRTSVHQDVPIAEWNSLKNAKSIGGFYNFYLKNKYQLEMNDEKAQIL